MPHRAAVKYGHYAIHVFHQLRWRLLVIAALVLVGGSQLALSLRLPYAKACYTVFMLMFVQPTIDFPEHWYNQVLVFAVPVIGLGALADAVVRLGYLVFSSKRKLQEWWIMEASLFRNHIVLCGLGRNGYRMARELLALGEKFVVIERDRECEFAEEILDAGVPVLFGDARHRKMLERANVGAARAILAATDDDLANLDAALTAREIKRDIKVVIRFFDDTLASKVASSFQIAAMSSSKVSAPSFVAAATGWSVLHAFQLENRTIHVADLRLERLAGRKIGDLQREFGVSVVYHKGDFTPDGERALAGGDTIVVMALVEKFRALEEANRIIS